MGVLNRSGHLDVLLVHPEVLPSELERIGVGVAIIAPGQPEQAPAFALHLDNFEGPCDLLLSLIAKHKLDITEVALSAVTDEFIAHVKAAGEIWDLEQTTSFLLVASTLLDLKAARLLPQGDVEDEEDLALLEAYVADAQSSGFAVLTGTPGEAPLGLNTTGNSIFNRIWTGLHVP